ncbi:MAG: alpha-xylosidase, partial [Asticcacaulis sp.]|nr:alpha-xylosidase [Asticcacaulis sp.]
MKIKALASASVIAMLMYGVAHAGTYDKTATGIIVHPDGGAAKELQLEVTTDSVIHVIGLDDPKRAQMPSLMAVAEPKTGSFTVEANGDSVVLKAARASAKVSLST